MRWMDARDVLRETKRRTPWTSPTSYPMRHASRRSQHATEAHRCASVTTTAATCNATRRLDDVTTTNVCARPVMRLHTHQVTLKADHSAGAAARHPFSIFNPFIFRVALTSGGLKNA